MKAFSTQGSWGRRRYWQSSSYFLESSGIRRVLAVAGAPSFEDKERTSDISPPHLYEVSFPPPEPVFVDELTKEHS
jgi:hypothetical protein